LKQFRPPFSEFTSPGSVACLCLSARRKAMSPRFHAAICAGWQAVSFP